jgi:signal transduction histidine kinase
MLECHDIQKDPVERVTEALISREDATALRKTRELLQHSQLLASLGEMTASIAHEVNNPLGSILLYSELMIAADSPPEIKRDLKVIHEEAKRATKVMTDLLTYSHREKSTMCRLDLNRILLKMLDMRQYTERIRNITATTSFQDHTLNVRGDASQVMQLFMNLLLNAEESLSESGGGNIIVSTCTEGEWARVSISDNGTGIPPENLSHMFYPFFTTKRMTNSTGLKLSTCYSIVTDHNGLIHAENNSIGGATFTVELPLAGTRRKVRASGRPRVASLEE